jgi:hypothetical protein
MKKMRKYFLSKWDIICKPKEQEGLGIEVLELTNRCLLIKWLFKLLTERKFGKNCCTINIFETRLWPRYRQYLLILFFWKGLMNVKDEFFYYRGYFKVGSRRLVWFRQDTCLRERSLASQYPSLYNFVAHKVVWYTQAFQMFLWMCDFEGYLMELNGTHGCICAA